MKKYIRYLVLILTFLFFDSCKKDPNIAEILKIVQELKLQNDNLKAELSKQSERLDALLQMMNGTNQQVTDLAKKIDAISKEIASILVQIDVLNKELKNTDADVAKILEQIAVLQKQSADLVAQINQLTAIPASPTLLEVGSITDKSMVLTWKDNADNEIGFKIERKISEGIWETVAVLNANTTTHTLAGLTENTDYTFRVLAYNLGVSLSSNTVTAKSLLKLEVDIKNGLVAYYPFNGNANDESGNNLNGTVQGAQLTSDRNNEAGKAYSFDTDQKIEVLESGSKNPYPFSISMWIRIDSSTDGNIFSKYISGSWNGFQLSSGRTNESGLHIYPYYLNGGTVPNGIIGGYGQTNPFIFPVLALNSWSHYVFTVSSTGGVLYRNGLEVSRIGWRSIPGPPSNNLTWIIGGPSSRTNNLSGWFKGKMDEIRIYNRALTQEEISYLYTK